MYHMPFKNEKMDDKIPLQTKQTGETKLFEINNVQIHFTFKQFRARDWHPVLRKRC